MSRVLSDDVKEVVYKKIRKLTGIKCDVCSTVIPAERNNRSRFPVYFEVTTGHNDWGNDSCESVEHYDVCTKCISPFVAKYLENVENSSKYINIETEHVYPLDVSE